MDKTIDEIDHYNLRRIIRIKGAEEMSFEYSSGYIEQATRNYPRVFYYNENNMIFYTKKDKSPNTPFVIVCGVGDKKIEAIESFVRKKRGECNKIIIKNVVGNDHKKLFKSGFEKYGKIEKWNETTKYDDNTYPQIVFNVKNKLDLFGPEYKKIRHTLSRFDRRYNIKILHFQNRDSKNFIRILNKWAKHLANRTGEKIHDLVTANKMYGKQNEKYFQYLVYEKRSKKYVGFMSFSIISEKCLAFNCLINDFNYTDSFSKILHEGIKIAARLGFSYINLQGSETYNQFKKKCSFAPDKLLYKRHLIFNPKGS